MTTLEYQTRPWNDPDLFNTAKVSGMAVDPGDTTALLPTCYYSAGDAVVLRDDFRNEAFGFHFDQEIGSVSLPDGRKLVAKINEGPVVDPETQYSLERFAAVRACDPVIKIIVGTDCFAPSVTALGNGECVTTGMAMAGGRPPLIVEEK